MFYIYMTENLLNGKKYIGQHKTNNINDSYLGSGILLKKAIEKYGKENFKKTILEECSTQEEANSKEKEWIKKYSASTSELFYNLSEGGQDGGGFSYYLEKLKNDPELKAKHEQKRLEKLKEYQQNNKEAMSKIGRDNIEKCHKWQLEHRESLVKQGKEYGQYNLQQWKEQNPEEYQQNKQKGFESMVKWCQDNPEKVKENLSKGPQANKEKNGKKVRCINNGKTFLSIKEAESFYGTYKDAIGRCLRGQLKTAGKDPQTGERLKWEYCNE